MLSYWGVETSQEGIALRTLDARAGATHGSDLLLLCISSGLHAYSYQGSIRHLREKVSGDAPVIVLQRPSLRSAASHYRVVIGYDGRRSSLIALDPDLDRACRIPYRTFARLWRPCGRWSLITVPPEQDEFAQALGGNPVFRYDLATAYLRRGDLRPAGYPSVRSLRK